MPDNTITIEGVTITVNAEGILLQDGWLLEKQIVTTDVAAIRDFLNTNFPAGPKA